MILEYFNRKVNKYIIGLFMIFLAALAVLCGAVNRPELPEEAAFRQPLFSVDVRMEEKTEQIGLWYDGAGTHYGFLPGCANMAQMHAVIPEAVSVSVNGTVCKNGDRLNGLQPGQEYPLEWTEGGETHRECLVFLRSENIPSLHLDVRSGNMEHIHRQKGNEEPGSVRLYDADGRLCMEEKLETVKGRGNATWDQAKKPYSIKFYHDTDVLDMGAAEKWILLPNCLDASNIRNQLVLDMAAQLELPYTPQCRWVDLYLNGDYTGLYLLCEKVEVHPERVNLTQPDAFLVSREKSDRVRQQNLTHVSTSSGVDLRVHHSNGDLAAIQKTFQSLENALKEPDGVDPETGKSWLGMIDLDSWVQKYLIEEISGNLDAGAISQFFYTDGSGKLFAGPVWDYDMSLGNPGTWQIDEPNMLYAGRPHLWSDSDFSWYSALYDRPEFRERLIQMYEESFRPSMAELLESGVSDCAREIRTAARMNEIRWAQASADGEIASLENYMQQRLAFLDSLWLEQEDCFTVTLWIPEHVTGCYAVEPGGTIPFWKVPEGTDTIYYEGWFNGADDMPFDFYAPVTEDTFVYLKEVDLSKIAVSAEKSVGLMDIVKYVPSVACLILMAILLCVTFFRSRKSSSGDPKKKYRNRRRNHERL